jgi:hypothetical protein
MCRRLRNRNMTRLKHVLVLTILILPMFVLAPTLVASPNEALASPEKVDTSLPAQFVEETLRVAVYAESNLTLPAYATGGVYTNHYQNVIDLLESAGYAVTALSTQDILDHELMVADYDAFVLPNQLPRESIINHIKDYWLGGGGILCFDSAMGYLFYAGLIDPSYEGDFMKYPENFNGRWAYQPFDGILTQERHPVTKSLDADTIYPFTEDAVYLGGFELGPLLGERYIELAIWPANPDWTLLVAFDNPDRGGKIVQLPGNCSQFETWMEPVVADAIDWITPRPKGRILVDLFHDNWFPIDMWDPMREYYPMETWRDGMVNHSYIVDKSLSALTAAKLANYDMLVVCMPNGNFTAAEVEAVRAWVENGGGLFLLADEIYLLDVAPNSNYLISPFDISVNQTTPGTGFGVTVVPSPELHPLHENALYLEFGHGSSLNITGDAYPLWFFDGNIVGAGQEYGEGRVIVSGDGNIIGDGLEVLNQDNYQYLLNVANWLTAATADVLLHVYNLGISDAWEAPAIDALNDLGIPFYLTENHYYMNLSLYSQQWSLVIIDVCWPGLQPYLEDFSSYLDTGGDLIVSWYRVDSFQTDPLYSKIGFEYSDDLPDKAPFHIWDDGHGIFNHPHDYGAMNFTAADDYGDEGDLLTVYPNATALAGYTTTDQPGNATIVLGFGGHALFNAYLIDQLSGDTDDSTYSDARELWENQIAFMYYDRPTIDHPADVTYMETEVGNEIVWHPVADAGPWEYAIWVNGSTEGFVPWHGEPIAINVDSVNASITTYEILVRDRLGYEIGDVVQLNVTEYVAPPTTPPPGLDPMLLLIIGGAIAGVVIILIVFTQMKKKK